MDKKYLRLSPLIFILFISAISVAEEEKWEAVVLAEPTTQNRQVLNFEIPKGKKDSLRIGILKLQTRKDVGFLEFEGRDLKKGTYEIVKTEECEELKKSYTKNRKPASAETLYQFTTEYGDFSGEKNLHAPLEELHLQDADIALVRLYKGKKALLSCGKETVQQVAGE
ncbi:MAG: hypothetical protein AB7O96_07795 [Pseudobdellovibrionaceae bacterium]